MTWTEAIAEILDELIADKKLEKTKVSREAGYQPNYLTKLLRGEKKFISNDELEPILKVVGISVIDLNQRALQKKTVFL